MNFSCFVLSRTTPTSALLKPDERFGFDLQCQLHLRAGASLQFRHDRVQDGVKRLCEAASAALADRSVLSGPRRGRPPGPAGPGASAPGPPPTPIKPRRVYGSVEIDINRPCTVGANKEPLRGEDFRNGNPRLCIVNITFSMYIAFAACKRDTPKQERPAS